MLTMLGIPNCDTVRKARRWLEERDIAYRLRDVRKQPLSTDEWRNLLTQDREGKLLNTRGPSFRESGLTAAELTADTRLQVLDEHPTAMKRPVMLAGDRLLGIGFSEELFSALERGRS